MRTVLAATALSLGCTGSSTPIDKGTATANGARAPLQDGSTMSNSSTCNATLDGLLRKDLAGMPALPADCTLDALAARIEIDGSDRRGILGQARQPAVYRGARVPGFDDAVKVWHRDGAVRKLDVDLPQLADVGALLVALGEPDARLDYYPSTVPKVREQGAWVYAARGLTLFMSKDGKNVVRFEVYPPTTAEAYARELFFTEPPRERP